MYWGAAPVERKGESRGGEEELFSPGDAQSQRCPFEEPVWDGNGQALISSPCSVTGWKG